MTHINAYYAEVEAAKVKVIQAKAELDAAETALKAHPDYEEEKPEVASKKVASKKSK